ncbi:MAG: SPASM domain-containing protein [Desulfobacterales bacterium]|nr:SPASM domain-containing protein [Desulfobacterales bacterium]
MPEARRAPVSGQHHDHPHQPRGAPAHSGARRCARRGGAPYLSARPDRARQVHRRPGDRCRRVRAHPELVLRPTRQDAPRAEGHLRPALLSHPAPALRPRRNPPLLSLSGTHRRATRAETWRHAEAFTALRDYDRLSGKCGACEYKRVCGGCRARAYEATGDYLAEEPLCSYLPRSRCG